MNVNTWASTLLVGGILAIMPAAAQQNGTGYGSAQGTNQGTATQSGVDQQQQTTPGTQGQVTAPGQNTYDQGAQTGTEPSQQQNTPYRANRSARRQSNAGAQGQMPQTANEWPLFGLAGLVLLAGGFALRYASRANAGPARDRI